LLALLVHSSVDFNMQIPANAILVFCLVALLSSQLQYATDAIWRRAGPGLKAGLSLAILVFVAYGGMQIVRLGREYRWLTLAEAESWRSLAQIGAYEKAFGVEPRNFETTCAIAEAFQTHSAQGGEDNAILATNAIVWFQRGMNLNRHDARNFAGAGWCWDWLALRQDELAGLHELAEQNYLKAEALDPKGYWTIKDVGRHFVQAGNYAAARVWFERSLKLQRRENEGSESYYNFSSEKLAEAATNQFVLPDR
jgi:tetratricopeptide (TPR) repeat protein